jgi:polar amino acid transport system ATP-binding protein
MRMIIATYEMSFAREVATQVCYLESDVIVEDGPSAQVFGEAKDDRTRRRLERVIDAGWM